MIEIIIGLSAGLVSGVVVAFVEHFFFLRQKRKEFELKRKEPIYKIRGKIRRILAEINRYQDFVSHEKNNQYREAKEGSLVLIEAVAEELWSNYQSGDFDIIFGRLKKEAAIKLQESLHKIKRGDVEIQNDQNFYKNMQESINIISEVFSLDS